MKTITTLLGACLIGTCGGYYTVEAGTLQLAALDEKAALETPAAMTPGVPIPAESRTLSGDYLSSVFAQRHHDWKKAGEYLANVMRATPDEQTLPKRAMVLAMGAGDTNRALELAKLVSAQSESSPLAELFLAMGAFKANDFAGASAHINKMPADSLSEFIMPLLKSWADAANNKYDVSTLSGNTIHLYHAAMISTLLKKDFDVAAILKKSVNGQTLSLEDLERIADLYVHAGENASGLEIYKKIIEQWPDHPSVGKKIQMVEAGQKFDPIAKVETASQGVAATLYDMANLLYRESADDSARVFAHMALYLRPEMTDGRLLLAAIDARNDRFEDAIASYNMVPSDNEFYLEARRRAADLMEENGETDRALQQLSSLAQEKGDVESLIKIGDIHRRAEDFPKAIEVYNEAALKLGTTVPKEYWNLLYVRGISYERAGQWDKAEADLKASLAYQPDHPFVLNYLGYAWADQGVNLDEALNLLQKAAKLQPDDGYIADSLGWAYYRMARYDEGLPYLERAVELLPYDPVINDHLGDGYWQVGRKREARFQWQRAGNFSKDDALTGQINDKLANGLTLKTLVKEATAVTPAVNGAMPGNSTGDMTAIP